MDFLDPTHHMSIWGSINNLGLQFQINAIFKIVYDNFVCLFNIISTVQKIYLKKKHLKLPVHLSKKIFHL